MVDSKVSKAHASGQAPHTYERVSHAAQNYLLALYGLAEDGLRSTPAQLAETIRLVPPTEHLATSLPSVLSMVRRMAREGLVEMSADKEVRLTQRGKVLAEEMARRHRLAERLLVDLLGLELYKAEVEAHQLEHAISPDVEAKIRERLGNPTTCPFGHPIPGSGYSPPPGKRFTLDKTSPQQTYVVERIPEEDQDLLRFLIEHGVLPGQDLQVVEAGQYRGIITFQTSSGEAAVGYEAAARIWVRQPPKDNPS